MLHGSGANRQVFAHQFESALGEMHRLIAFDLPGHGESANAEDPETSYSLRGVADIAAGVLNALNIDRAIAYGWSMGGHVVIEMMDRHHNRLAGAAITGSPPVGRGPLAMLRGFQPRWDILLASKQSFSQKDAERFERLCYGVNADLSHIETILRADGRMRSIFLRSLNRGECADQKLVVETSTIPLAVIDGEDDPIVRRDYVDNLAYARLWENEVRVVAAAGHAPFISAANVFNAILHRFAASVDIAEQDLPYSEQMARLA
jgi:pimeloyl-ACP methyl ester carboxylesterase